MSLKLTHWLGMEKHWDSTVDAMGRVNSVKTSREVERKEWQVKYDEYRDKSKESKKICSLY